MYVSVFFLSKTLAFFSDVTATRRSLATQVANKIDFVPTPEIGKKHGVGGLAPKRGGAAWLTYALNSC